jgi:single-strand DNA-binding protein
MSINVVNLVGHVGSDPDVRYFESGSVKCRLTLAVDRASRNKDEPDWFNLEIWGKTAEVAANYVRKGTQIAVQGSLKIDSWSDRQSGAQRTSPVVVVRDLRLLGSKRDNADLGGGGSGGGGGGGGGYTDYDEF